MGGHAGRARGHGDRGKRLRAVYRHLESGGPSTDDQLVLRVIDSFNCTPSEAIRELRENPWIYRLLAARAMQEAHSAVVRWENTSPKAKEDTEPPSGPWVERVARYMTEDVRGEVEARKRAAERLKR